jgi:hypothetical protein
MRVSPREKTIQASFSPGEMRHMRVSPRKKTIQASFSPGESSTHASFSPGESDTGEFLPGEKCDTCEFLPGTGEFLPMRNATHASFSPGENDTLSGAFLPRLSVRRRVQSASVVRVDRVQVKLMTIGVQQPCEAPRLSPSLHDPLALDRQCAHMILCNIMYGVDGVFR